MRRGEPEMSKTLEQRVQRLEDIIAIANLKARYLDTADGGWDRISHDAEQVKALVADDFTWNGSLFGSFEGVEGAAALWRQCRFNLPFAYHVITNPLIEVDGDNGHGEWHVQWYATDKQGTELWAMAVYQDRFVRTENGWKIKSVAVSNAFSGPSANGWAANMERNPAIIQAAREHYGEPVPDHPY